MNVHLRMSMGSWSAEAFGGADGRLGGEGGRRWIRTSVEYVAWVCSRDCELEAEDDGV